MRRLARYLKGSLSSLLLIVLLLILQAWCDLELPTYTARIITQGIQQRGIESPVPERLSAQSLSDLLLFLSEEDAAFLESCYEEEAPGVYSLRPLPSEEQGELAALIAPGEMLLLMLTSGSDLSALAGDAAGDFTVPENALETLRILPAGARGALLSRMEPLLASIPEATRTSSAILFAGAEYERLGEDLGARQNRYLLHTGGRMLLLSLLVMLCTILVSFLATRLAARFSRNVRRDVYAKVMSFHDEEFHRFSTASLITRSTNDIQQVQFLLSMGLRMLLYAPIIGVGGVLKVVRQGASLSWIIVLALALLGLLIFILFKVAMPRFVSLQSLIDRLNLVTREQLTGVMITRAFSAEDQQEERFEKANRDLTRTNLFVNRCMTFMMPVMMMIMNGVSVLIVYTGAYSIDAGRMQVGDLMAFIQYTMQIIMSFLMISLMSVMIPRAKVAADRIGEVLGTKVRIQDRPDPVRPQPPVRGEVEFDHVSFAYPGAKANTLTDISFTAKAGETIAFIGSTGSGKSTLVSLIPRFYDATEGTVRVDGVDVKDLSMKDLRSRIGFVAQKSVLFSGTIASNIALGRPDAPMEEIEEAARIAQAEPFIRDKDLGYDSSIAQGGTNVSGGQKQRLAIARAVLRRPEILILDDSFSALDFKTDSALRRALKEELSGTTTLIVAQRISTILEADQILVLDGGRVVGRGRHEELLEGCEVYRQIALSQLSAQELAG